MILKAIFVGKRPAALKAARALLLLALVGAGYLAVTSISGGAVAGCGPGSGCNDVLSSRWAYLLGLPVSLLAMGVYLCLLILSWTAVSTGSPAKREWSWFLVDACGGLVIGAAGWFGFLQYHLLGEWCKYCLVTHASAALAAIFLMASGAAMRSRTASDGGGSRRWSRIQTSVIAGGLGLVVLIAGQLLVKKPLYALSTTGSGNSGLNSGTLRLFGGQFKLDPQELPVYGSADATNLIVSLFDCTCVHCRHLHPLLKAAAAHYAGRLGIISLPVPLDSDCNPLIFVTSPENEHACDYARLSLAVWRAQPAAYAEFDEWLFASPSVPSLDETRQKAEFLAGKEALDRALRSAWVSEQLKTDIKLYTVSSRAAGDYNLPQLIIGNVTMSGSVDTLDDLLHLIGQHASLDLRKPKTQQTRAE